MQDPDFQYDEAVLVKNAKEIPTPNMSDEDDDDDMSAFGIRGAVTRELIDTDSEDDTSAFILKSKQVHKQFILIYLLRFY